MSFGLTFTIIFGVVFSIALFFGFLYEKELKEFEKILLRYVRIKLKAKELGMSTQEYVEMKRRAKKTQKADLSNVINFNDWVA